MQHLPNQETKRLPDKLVFRNGNNKMNRVSSPLFNATALISQCDVSSHVFV